MYFNILKLTFQTTKEKIIQVSAVQKFSYLVT